LNVTSGSVHQQPSSSQPLSLRILVQLRRLLDCCWLLDSCGVYFGTTAGEVYVSADGGDNWALIVRNFPCVLSLEVVPHDISVVGVDDIQIAGFTSPRLTTIRQPLRIMGAMAVSTLLQRIDGGEVAEETVVRPELVVRESTARVST
jgi:hypothetical protein